MHLRPYNEKDLPALYGLFYETVHTVNAAHYTLQQRNAWAPPIEEFDFPRWQKSLAANHTVIAEENGRLAGWADIATNGYLDHLFVSRHFQRRGVATLLLNDLEAFARAQKLKRIHTHASDTARGFFEKHGYQFVSRKEDTIRGVPLAYSLLQKKI